MPIHVVIFDLDDTLIVEEAVARASLRSTARLLPGADPDHVEEVVLACARRSWRAGPHYRVCRDLGIASWEGLWASFEGCHPVLEGVRAWAPTYRLDVWESALAALGWDHAVLASAMAESYEESQRAGHPLIEGAAAAVRAIADRHRLGLLTNGPGDIQHLKLDQTGLAQCFDAVVISGEVGVGKPSREAFVRVLDALDAGPKEAVMVGDSWERDITGALASGLSAVWVAGGRPLSERAPGAHVISSIGELSKGLLDGSVGSSP